MGGDFAKASLNLASSDCAPPQAAGSTLNAATQSLLDMALMYHAM
jgi:hypothetical protein